MDFKVIWTDPAIENLQEITAYISRDNSVAAVKFGDELFHHVEVLETFPFIGPTYPRGERGPTREIIFRKYRIFYRVSEERKLVEILAVWHGARDDGPFEK
jgi:toxin ParE1/3/4